jgi:hypothetical protein
VLERHRTGVLIALALAAAAPAAQGAEPAVLLVQPPPWDGARQRFDAAPLAALIGDAIGRPVEVLQAADALSHWRLVRSPRRYRMALEEPHFSAWRIRHHGFVAVARAAADVRFAVVVRPGILVTGPLDLVARRVAVPSPPALAALRLLELFPDPARGPRLVPAEGPRPALDALARGDVEAVVVAVEEGEPVGRADVALVTDASPARAFSVDPALAAEAGTALLRALRAAGSTDAGRAALAGVGLGALTPATALALEDSERLLRGTWGYLPGVGGR